MYGDVPPLYAAVSVITVALPAHVELELAVTEPTLGLPPVTIMEDEPVPVQPLLSVTVAVYLKVDVPTVAPDMDATVVPLVVEDAGLTVVLPGEVTTAVVQA